MIRVLNMAKRMIGFKSIPFRKFSSSELDKKLLSDIQNLGNILGSCIKDHNAEAFDAVVKLRSLSAD